MTERDQTVRPFRPFPGQPLRVAVGTFLVLHVLFAVSYLLTGRPGSVGVLMRCGIYSAVMAFVGVGSLMSPAMWVKRVLLFGLLPSLLAGGTVLYAGLLLRPERTVAHLPVYIALLAALSAVGLLLLVGIAVDGWMQYAHPHVDR